MFKRFFASRYALPAIALQCTLGLSLTHSTAHAQWIKDLDRIERIEDEGDEKSEEPSSPVIQQDGPAKAMRWFYDQRKSGLGYIPKDALTKAYSQTAAMRASVGKGGTVQSQMAALAAQPQWKLVGPSNIGGRISTIAVHPTNANIAYVGAADGGIWKTTDGGAHWDPLTDQMHSLAMGALGIDPNNPNVIYAGTGEYAPAIDAYSGYGILKSTDGGHSWSNTGQINVGAFTRVIVNPTNSNIVYAAGGRSGGGVLRSTDAGRSWDRLAGGLATGEVSDLALAMNGSTAVLYAGVAYNGIYRSDDGGNTWNKVYSDREMRRMQVDVNPKNWQQVVVMSVDNAGNLESLMRSDDGGDGWQDISSGLSGIFGGNSQGWYDAYVRVDPTDFNRIFAGGISVWMSEDGGSSWEDVGGAYAGGMHPDQHALEFAPSDHNKVFVGNDGGIFLSSDAGANWTNETAPIAITQFYGIGVDQTVDDLTYGGTQDNGTLTGQSVSDWSSAYGGDGTYTQVDPKNPSVVYFARTQTEPQRLVNGNAQSLGGIGSNDKISWLNPFAADQKNGYVYFATNYLYYMTSNTSSTWVRRSKKLGPVGDTNTAATFIDAFGDGASVIIGTSTGQVIFTGDNGKTYVDASKGLPGRYVTCVRFDPSATTNFYATVSGFGGGHVFKTTDKGQHWTDISGSLPDIPVNSIVLDPDNSQSMYIGTDVGVFFSPNGGGVWIPYGQGLPNTPVVFMELHRNKRVLRVGTHGRSIWEVPIVNDVPGIAAPSQRSLWVMGDPTNIIWHGFADPVRIDLSLDQGATWQNISTSASGTSMTIPHIPYAPSNNALVKISDGSQEVTSPLFQIIQRKAGSSVATVTELPMYLYDVGYDKDENVLWGTNYSTTSSTIYKLDPDHGTILDSVVLGTGKENLTGIKYDPKSKHLFIHQALPTDVSFFYEVTKAGAVIRKLPSPATYGTGIFVRDDSLFLVDRLTSSITKTMVSNPALIQNPLEFERHALYGPRCLTYNVKLNRFMLTFTDFQGTNSTNAHLEGSYLLYLDPATGAETNSFIMQEGTSEGVNIRGMEWDPRNGGNSAWITTLSGSNSAKLTKITLEDGPVNTPVKGVETALPAGYALGQNFPNPFNPSTSVPFTIPTAGIVEIRLMDGLGREVYRSESFEFAGEHDRMLELSSLPSGSYVYELRFNGSRIGGKKMTLLK